MGNGSFVCFTVRNNPVVAAQNRILFFSVSLPPPMPAYCLASSSTECDSSMNCLARLRCVDRSISCRKFASP